MSTPMSCSTMPTRVLMVKMSYCKRMFSPVKVMPSLMGTMWNDIVFPPCCVAMCRVHMHRRVLAYRTYQYPRSAYTHSAAVMPCLHIIHVIQDAPEDRGCVDGQGRDFPRIIVVIAPVAITQVVHVTGEQRPQLHAVQLLVAATDGPTGTQLHVVERVLVALDGAMPSNMVVGVAVVELTLHGCDQHHDEFHLLSSSGRCC